MTHSILSLTFCIGVQPVIRSSCALLCHTHRALEIGLSANRRTARGFKYPPLDLCGRMNMRLRAALLFSVCSLARAFVLPALFKGTGAKVVLSLATSTALQQQQQQQQQQRKVAVLVGAPAAATPQLEQLLTKRGYAVETCERLTEPILQAADIVLQYSIDYSSLAQCSAAGVAVYAYAAATGMYKLITACADEHLRKYIDPAAADSYERLLIDKGWGFFKMEDSSSSSSSSSSDAVSAHTHNNWQRYRSESMTVSALGYSLSPMTDEQVAVAAAELSEEQQAVLLHGGTEKPHTGLTANGYEGSSAAAGLYTCAIDGLPLFDSSAKLPIAGDTSAWPSFTAAVDSEHLIERREYSAGMLRTEVVCGRCGCHIGHVFAAPRRRRYCTNAAAMKFVPVEQLLPAESRPTHTATAELATDSVLHRMLTSTAAQH
jgi:peptide-methionine (R)-S-oxide reductase